MQEALRPYATAGIALVGASMIAVTPMVLPPPPAAQVRSVRLVDAWSDLVTNTTANLDSIVSNASSSDITQLFNEFLTNPFGVIEAFANFDPTVTTDLTSLPATISVELPPGLELAIAGLGATGAALTTLETVAQQLQTDPSLSNISEGLATVLNADLNGTDTISLLGGAITIPLYNGLLAPETSANIDINLPDLINALGLGNTPLTDLDLSSLLSQIGLGDLNLGTLFSDLTLDGGPLSDLGLGTLLAGLTDPITTLGGLLNSLGLAGLDLPSLSLTNILSGLGLDTNVDLSTLTLSDVLSDFGINSPLSDLSNLSLSSILSSFGVDLPTGATLGATTLTGLLTDLNLNTLQLGTLLGDAGTAIGGPTETLINTLLAIPTVETTLNQLNLGELLTGVTLGNGGSLSLDTLLGDLGINLPSNADLANIDISDVLTSLGITLPGNLDLGTLLGDLGLSSATGDLTLGDLLGDLGTVANPILGLDITDLLNGLNLGGLLGDLGLSNLPLDLSNLGDLSGLNLGDLLGDLGLGNLASVSVEPLGGFDTLLVDLVPQQILASLGM
jgi:hypothetical protein